MSLYRKYRPKTFDEVAGQKHVIASVKRQIETGKIAHAFLFSGARGVGKTTIARLIARALNCTDDSSPNPCQNCQACKSIEEGKAIDVIEIDAASHTGVDNVRENIIEATRVRPTQLKKKVFIIDEVHMLSKGAFNALLKTLEEPPEYVVFILATTELHKIPDTIISRCQRFDFGRIAIDEMIQRLNEITEKENRKITNDVLENIAQRSEGCLRDAESLLGQIITLEADTITMEEASTIMPASNLKSVLELIKSISENKAKEALEKIAGLQSSGEDIKTFADKTTSILRSMLLNTLGSVDLKTQYTKEQVELITELTKKLRKQRIQEILERIMLARKDLSLYKIETLAIELAVIDLCKSEAEQMVEPEKTQQEPTKSQQITKEQNPEPQIKQPTTKKAKVTSETESTEPEPKPEAPEQKKATEAEPKIEEIQKKWDNFKKSVKERHASLPLALELSQPIEIKDRKLIVRVEFAFYAETLNQEKNNSLLVDVLEKTMGAKLALEAIHDTAATECEEEDVAKVLDAFEGEVVN